LVLQFVVQRIYLHAEPSWGSHGSASFGEYQWSLACWKAAQTGSQWMHEFEHWFTPEARQLKFGDRLPSQKNDAYKRKNGVVGGKNLNALLHLALHSCQIGNSILYFHE
jgi:hypothetical protein